MTDYKTPHVHQAILEILKGLAVEKDGKLPSNMSGKAYVTAGNLSAHVKDAFVAAGLIVAPSEQIFHHEVTQDKTGRTLVAVSVNGTYAIYSTVDGSKLLIGGVGDGLATGTSVANNIASTNAFKNALLRTFMVTETSVEERAKNGIDDGVDRTPEKPSALKALQEELKGASQAMKGNLTGSAYLSSLVDANPELFHNDAGEPLSFAQVWADESKLKSLAEIFRQQQG